MIIGAQLYTVREFCKDLDSLSKTLEKIADIGYTAVQISGTCAYDTKWLKGELDKNGLRCVLTHTPATKLQENISDVITSHDILECKNIGLGRYNFNEGEAGDTYRSFVNTYSPVIKALKNGGKYFMYHNHDIEFRKVDSEIIFKKLEKDFSPDELGFTLDTYWVQAGGGDPAYWIERLSGRVPCIHLKDFAYGGVMSVLGEGNINFDRVFEKAEKAGTEYMLVEQDNCNGENPFECLRRSYDYLTSKGFR